MAVFSGVLEEGINELDNEATTKAKFFYQSCMDLRKCSGSLAAFFTQIISQCITKNCRVY